MDKKIVLIISLIAILTIAAVLAYIILSKPVSPVLFVYPQTTQKTVGQNFTVSINISDVADLYGWRFKLRWNATILDVVNVTEGSFLKNGGDTFFVRKVDNTMGYVTVDCTLLGNIFGVDGNGVLATIEFHVKNSGNCDLGLYDTMLLNSHEQSITHKLNDGHFSTIS